MDSETDKFGKRTSLPIPGHSGRADMQQSGKNRRFGGAKQAASSASFFSRSKKRSDPNVEDLKASTQSLDKVPHQRSESNLMASLNSLHSYVSADNDIKGGQLGSRMKAALKSLRKDKNKGKADLKTKQRLSRKIRNSDPHIQIVMQLDKRGKDYDVKSSKNLGYMQLRAANLTGTMNDDSTKEEEDQMGERLLAAAQKDNFCDIEIMGKEVSVKAPSFLLACQSTVFEEICYPKQGGSESPTYSLINEDDPKKIRVQFASQSTIQAVIHFCATQELPVIEINEANMRTIAQVHLFAQLFKIPSLVDASHRTARRLMNKAPPLVCAVFDEYNLLRKEAESENYWGLTMEKNDELKTYVLSFLRESPMESIMGHPMGVLYLSPISIEAIVRDQDIDFDEYSMWRTLNLW